MNTLKLTVDCIKNKYYREFEKENPKYLFRGENCLYTSTKSNYHRLTISDLERKELVKYMQDLSIAIFDKFFYSDKFLFIDTKTDLEYKQLIIEIGAWLQHYGFYLQWLDFTSEVDVAAFFASYKNNTGKGRIWIAETQFLIGNNEQIFKLDKSFAKRPSIQNAYALKMEDNYPDFQNTEHFKALKFDFDVSDEDKRIFNNKELLCTANDEISDFIIDYIELKKSNNEHIAKMLSNIRKDLIEMKTITNN